MSPHLRPPVDYNNIIAVSVFFPSNARIDPTTQQLIGEICTWRYARTSATVEVTSVVSTCASVIPRSALRIIFTLASAGDVYVSCGVYVSWWCVRRLVLCTLARGVYVS